MCPQKAAVAPVPRTRTERLRLGRLWLAFVLLVGLSTVSAPATAEEDWPQAVEPRDWSFPRDHGAHPKYRTEWWYFTGNLSGPRQERYGYQLTIFRVGLRSDPTPPHNPWAVRDIYMAHFALTEAEKQRFRHADRLSRSGPGLAGASDETMDVWVFDWNARMEGETIYAKARTRKMEIDLELAPRKPVVIHGPGGVSQKGPAPGQASYYASFTDLATRGWLRTEVDGTRVPVEGTSWFDQEFGSNQLAEDQAGWDWVSIHLSDGRDLMVYLLRRKDETIEPASSGTLVEPDGTSRHLALPEIALEAMDRWKSPRSGAKYPIRWRLQVRDLGIDLILDPLVPDQEWVTEGFVGVTYWEGAVEGKGMSGGHPVTCAGYVEMVGYAREMGGQF